MKIAAHFDSFVTGAVTREGGAREREKEGEEVQKHEQVVRVYDRGNSSATNTRVVWY